MGFSGWHLLILALVALLIFGGSGRISSIMGDVAKGIKSFKKGLSEDTDTVADSAKTLETQPVEMSKKASEKAKT
jgi:sec-independent protein translocase protein TatA